MSFRGWVAKKFFSKQINKDIYNIASKLNRESTEIIKAQVGITSQTGISGRLSDGSKFHHGLSRYSIFTLNHFSLRSNARRAFAENVQARAIIERKADTIADTGLILDSIPKSDILGIDEEKASEWARDVENRFNLWATSKKQNRSAVMNFYQAQRLYQVFHHRDGESFVRLYYSPDRELINPLQFEYIDPNQIREDAYTSSFGGPLTSDGIIRDSKGVEESYKVWVKDKSDHNKLTEKVIPARGPKSKRIFMLHGFIPEYAGQGRGFSPLAHALQEFSQVTDFSLAHIMKAISQSNLSIFVKPSKDNPASNIMEGILTDSGAGPASVAKFGSQPTTEDDSSPVTPTLKPVNYSPLPEATTAIPGSVGAFNLDAGEDLKGFVDTAPSTAFGEFVKAFTSHLAASLSIPIEVVLMQFEQNYSASRAALILFWRVVIRFRKEMESDLLNPVYEAWLSEEIAAGRIQAPGWNDPILRAAWLNANWIGCPLPSIDPAKTAKADQIYVEMGAQTLDKVARGLNGSDGSANRRRLRKEYEELPTSPFGKSQGNNPDSQTEDNDKEKNV
jgi:lambda family phage portal protein